MVKIRPKMVKIDQIRRMCQNVPECGGMCTYVHICGGMSNLVLAEIEAKNVCLLERVNIISTEGEGNSTFFFICPCLLK